MDLEENTVFWYARLSLRLMNKTQPHLGVSPFYRILSAFAAVTVVMTGLCRGQEERFGHGELEYVRDDSTELTISKGSGEDAWSVDLRHYSESQERDLYFQEDTKRVSGQHVAEIEVEDRKSTVKINNPGKSTISVSTSNLSDLGGKLLDLSGTYHQITAEERLQRARKRLEKADLVLNDTYKKVRTELGKERAIQLRDLQRDWLKHRDSMSEWEAGSVTSGAAQDFKAVPAYWDKMLDLTTTRTDFLKLYSGRDIPKGITGEYRDAYGGHLSLKESKGWVEFSFEVVRGPSLHTGEISGRARVKGNRVHFKEDPEQMEDKEQAPAELTFTFVDGHIVKVEGKNTQAYHGARAYFDGEYFKEKPEKP